MPARPRSAMTGPRPKASSPTRPEASQRGIMHQPLEGIRIVEQGTFITGPCCGMMLADIGADVIKVESPGTGDPYRNFRGGLYSAHFQAYNRGKRSITLNLKDEADTEIFRKLIAEADV